MINDESMLLVLPVPFRRQGGALFFEAQACNGIERWADHFTSLIAACPVLPESMAASSSSIVWKDLREIHCADRVEFVPLPWAFSVSAFARHYAQASRQLRACIERTRYLQFAPWGFLGDWASVSALEAIKLGRAYSLHIDIVNHVASRRAAKGQGLPRRIKAAIEAPLMKLLHAHLARHCALGLWHGHDTYQVYSAWCKNNHNVHDVHTKPADCISPEECEAKAREALHAPALRVCYTGRATVVKAPLDWVRAVAHARNLGARIEGSWLGDGPDLSAARALAGELGIADAMSLPGFIRDRGEVLKAIRNAHVMPFTHITPESPRCLLESLLSGTPIAGYDNAFAKDLIDGHGGGRLVPIHNWKRLGEELARLEKDRAALATLIREAGANGARFNDDAVFQERSELIKKYLP